jgi:hypothetical protein
MELVVNRTYRAKKPSNVNGYYNDRTIIYMNEVMGTLQYDGPAVALGRHYPRMDIKKFQAWVGSDVTDSLPEGKYEPYSR